MGLSTITVWRSYAKVRVGSAAVRNGFSRRISARLSKNCWSRSCSSAGRTATCASIRKCRTGPFRSPFATTRSIRFVKRLPNRRRNAGATDDRRRKHCDWRSIGMTWMRFARTCAVNALTPTSASSIRSAATFSTGSIPSFRRCTSSTSCRKSSRTPATLRRHLARLTN